MVQIKTTDNITTIKTDKFKTTLIKVSFKAQLKRETVTARILLANVLRNSSAKWNSKKMLSAHLENLYGANLSVTAKKQGTLHTINFYMNVANEKFLKSAPPLFEEALEVLTEIIFKPNVLNGAFNKDVVTLEKRLLKEEIESIYDDKPTYALKQMIAHMCESENFGVSGDGYIDDLANLNEETLLESYQAMLSGDEMSVKILGDVNHDEVMSMFDDHFKKDDDTRTSLTAVDHEEKELQGVTTLSETQAVHQTKLNIGYRTNTRITDPDYIPLLVFNGVFGAFAHSKLFTNVREKESLCYYCAAQLDNFKGLLYVYSGLDQEQVKKAIGIIDQQLQDVATGNFTEKELLLAKKSIINAKRESLDAANGMLADLEMNVLLGLTVDEFIERIQSVTKDEVAAVAKKIKKDTVFTLETEDATKHEVMNDGA